MRRDDDIGPLYKCARRSGLALDHIYTCSREATGFQPGNQCLIVNEWPPAHVNEEAALFDVGQPFSIEQMARRIGQRRMQDYNVAGRQHLV